jgi:putative transposase
LPLRQLLDWLELFPSRFYEWQKRHRLPNRHNSSIPKSHWLLPWEKNVIIKYAKLHPDEGYRRLTFMMLDEHIVAASPSSVYRVLKVAGLLLPSDQKASKKGQGFEQPQHAHEHWHIDISYINIACTFYYLISILDGYSRFIVHWELRERMQACDVEITLQRALERYTGVKPRIISDNGKQFIAKDFKELVRLMEMTHVTTSPHYPQSNGKLERYHRSLKSECVRPAGWCELSQAITQMEQYVTYYNTARLHSAIGYIAPIIKLQGLEATVFARRKKQLSKAKQLRILVQREQAEKLNAQIG